MPRHNEAPPQGIIDMLVGSGPGTPQYVEEPGIFSRFYDSFRTANQGLKIYKELREANPDASESAIKQAADARLGEYKQQLVAARDEQRAQAEAWRANNPLPPSQVGSYGEMFVRTIRAPSPEEQAREAARQQQRQQRSPQPQGAASPQGGPERAGAGSAMSAEQQSLKIQEALQQARVNAMVDAAKSGQWAVTVPRPELLTGQIAFMSLNSLNIAPPMEPPKPRPQPQPDPKPEAPMPNSAPPSPPVEPGRSREEILAELQAPHGLVEITGVPKKIYDDVEKNELLGELFKDLYI